MLIPHQLPSPMTGTKSRKFYQCYASSQGTILCDCSDKQLYEYKYCRPFYEVKTWPNFLKVGLDSEYLVKGGVNSLKECLDPQFNAIFE